MFYTFDQNNSGGSFQKDEDVTLHVIIEAENADEANDKAEMVGLYFDGLGDCSCCGDRWYETYESEHTSHETPQLYGEDPIEHGNGPLFIDWIDDKSQAYCYVYYANGDKVGYFRNPATGKNSKKHVK